MNNRNSNKNKLRGELMCCCLFERKVIADIENVA
jgi:hypothetical protein